MKFPTLFSMFCGALFLIGLSQCTQNTKTESTASTSSATSDDLGQAAVKDDESQKDVVKVAIGSPDHTTLVAAIKAADLVDDLSNAGPFTVFAPTNAAFDLLPAGTVESLLKPENKSKLEDILQYHVAVGVYKTNMLHDGQIIGMAYSGNVKIGVKDGKVTVNGANILASVPASNGIVHVIDKVLLPE